MLSRPKLRLFFVTPDVDTVIVFKSKHLRCSGNDLCDLGANYSKIITTT